MPLSKPPAPTAPAACAPLLLILLALLATVAVAVEAWALVPLGELATVVCSDGGSSCPGKSTCCATRRGASMCCPLGDGAVCCATGDSCCAAGYECDAAGSRCLLAGAVRHPIPVRFGWQSATARQGASALTSPGAGVVGDERSRRWLPWMAPPAPAGKRGARRRSAATRAAAAKAAQYATKTRACASWR